VLRELDLEARARGLDATQQRRLRGGLGLLGRTLERRQLRDKRWSTRFEFQAR
jgi:hypothetical protein